MKSIRLGYYIVLSLFSLAILLSAYFYIFHYGDVALEFNKLGYPDHLVGIVAFGQVNGLSIIISNSEKSIKEWAYTGFFINFLCAFIAHFFSKHGNGALATLFLILLDVLYILNKLYNSEKASTSEVLKFD
ncbi:MAG: DoxX family protein [Flavobacteriaceae bacterium]